MVDQPGKQSAERALIDYLDGLLHDSDEPLIEQSVPVGEPVCVTIAAPAKVTQLLNVRSARPVRVVEPLQTFAEPRPFAEPMRPLRMPLPPLAYVSVPVETAPVIAEPAAPTRVASAAVSPPTAVPLIKAPPVKAPPIAAPEIIPPAIVDPSAAAETIENDAHTATSTPPLWAVNGRPQWAQQAFECLLFKSGGLTLAVPLVELGSIYPLEEGDVTGIFGQIDWFLGLMHTKYGNVRVVDTARVVMPERYQDEMTAAYHFVLTLDGSDWGLAIDAIAGTALLDPDAVRWRSDRSKRPWLAGTVIEKMCALLDVAQMRHMFNQLDRKRGGRPPR